MALSTHVQDVLKQEVGLLQLRSLVRDVPNFPKPGVSFKDISPLLADAQATSFLLETMERSLRTLPIFDSEDGPLPMLAALESRGFLWHSLAHRMRLGFVMLRNKAGKTYDPISLDSTYSTEYSSGNVLEMPSGILAPGQPVVLIDDVLATGGSILAGCALVRKAGGVPIAAVCPIEVLPLGGRKRLETEGLAVQSVLTYPHDDAQPSSLPCLTWFNPCPYKPIDPEAHALDDRTVLIYPPSMAELAEHLLEISPNNFRKGLVDWARFPDGSPNLRFEHPQYLANKDVVFLVDARLDDALALQQALLLVLPRQMIKSLQIVLSFFGFGTMERVTEEGELAAAEPFLKMLSNVESTMKRKPTLRLLDIHALPERFYVRSDNVIVRMDTALDLLMHRITFLPDDPSLQKTFSPHFEPKVPISMVFFPDDGAKKRFGANPIFRFVTTGVCSKKRVGDSRITTISEISNPSERMWEHVLIVDDLVMSGGTLLECRSAVLAEAKRLGVPTPPKISCYVTHAVFPNQSWKRIAREKGPNAFEHFWCTDSNPHTAMSLVGVAPFEVLSVAVLYASVLCRKKPPRVAVNQSTLIRSLPLAEPKTLLLVASCQPDKLEAAYRGLVRLSKSRTPSALRRIAVAGVSVQPSNCPPQPLGRHQTTAAAEDRIESLRWECRKFALFSSPPKDLAVLHLSMESGVVSVAEEDEKLLHTRRFNWSMWTSPSGFADMAVVFASDGKIRSGPHHGEQLSVSAEAVRESVQHLQQKTVGQVYEQKHGWPSGSWHFVCSGRSRSDLMVDAVESALKSVS